MSISVESSGEEAEEICPIFTASDLVDGEFSKVLDLVRRLESKQVYAMRRFTYGWISVMGEKELEYLSGRQIKDKWVYWVGKILRWFVILDQDGKIMLGVTWLLSIENIEVLIENIRERVIWNTLSNKTSETVILGK